MDYSYQTELNSLRQDFSLHKSMVLYIGAGVDGESLLWNELLKKLIEASGFDEEEENALGKLPNDLQAAILKKRIGTPYISIIQDFLYSKGNRISLQNECKKYMLWKKTKCKEKPQMQFFTLFVLADMIVHCRHIRAVVTQNYNNFLTEAINLVQEGEDNNKIIPIDVYDGWNDQAYRDNSMLIYHVHGYIAPSWEMKTRPESNHIVLSQDESYNMQRNVFSWQTATQIHFFTHHTCLIIGLSLDDMTTLRLVSWSNPSRSGEKIYYLTANSSTDGQKTLFYLKQDYYDSIGLHTIYDNEGYYHLLTELYNISIKSNENGKQ